MPPPLCSTGALGNGLTPLAATFCHFFGLKLCFPEVSLDGVGAVGNVLTPLTATGCHFFGRKLRPPGFPLDKGGCRVAFVLGVADR